MKKILTAITMLSLGAALIASDAYIIETVITKNDQVIDSPSLIAPIKQAGAIEAERENNKYELLMEVDDEQDGVVTLYTNLILNGKFHKQKAMVPIKEEVAINLDDIRLHVKVIPYD